MGYTAPYTHCMPIILTESPAMCIKVFSLATHFLHALQVYNAHMISLVQCVCQHELEMHAVLQSVETLLNTFNSPAVPETFLTSPVVNILLYRSQSASCPPPTVII